eukprot:272643-Alexandrium_andersonii.AAC.1
MRRPRGGLGRASSGRGADWLAAHGCASSYAAWRQLSPCASRLRPRAHLLPGVRGTLSFPFMMACTEAT